MKVKLFLLCLLCSSQLLLAQNPLQHKDKSIRFQPAFSEVMKSTSKIQLNESLLTNPTDFEQKISQKKYTPAIREYHKSAARYRIVKINTAIFKEKINSKQVELALFDDTKVNLTTDIPPSIGAHGSVLYSGHSRQLDGDLQSSAITIIDGKVMGKIWKDGKLFIIEPINEFGEYIIFEQKKEDISDQQHTQCSEDHDHSYCSAKAGEYVEVCEEDILHLLDGELEISAPALVADPAYYVADIVTYYDANTVDYFGGNSAAQNKITQFINETNTAFHNSEVNALLNSTKIAYDNNINDLDDIANRRDSECVDLGTFVGNSIDSDAAGTARRQFTEGEDGGVMWATPSSSNNKFTYAHEIGHLYDANHYDDETDSDDYRGSLIGNDYCSLMTYTSFGGGRTRVLYFSNPAVDYLGNPTGSSTRRNAVRMNYRADNVAKFTDTYLDDCPSGDISTGEDVYITQESVSPTTIDPGETISVSATQHYTGDRTVAELPNIDIDYWLSKDCDLNTSSDERLGGDSSSLGSDDSYDGETATLTIPANTAPGTYYILFEADADQEVSETTGSNNIECIKITINKNEDIYLSQTEVSPTSVLPGNSISVSVRQHYTGNRTVAELPNIDIDYWLSTNCNLNTSSDERLGGDSSSIGSDDTYDPETETLTIPSNTTPGKYYILFEADADQEVSETTGSNNIECVEIEVLAACTTEVISTSTFESNYGDWNDGGDDCTRSSSFSEYASNGIRCVRLRDNTSESTMTTDNFDFSNSDEITVDFSYIANSMESGEDFWLQLSTNGGSSFQTVRTWASGSEFENNVRMNESVVIPGTFSSQTKLRFRCDASSNADQVYLDDIEITACQVASGDNDEVEDSETQMINYEKLIHFSLFPNPTDNYTSVNIETIIGKKGVNISVYNNLGVRLQTHRIEEVFEKYYELDVSELSGGVYIIQIDMPQHKSISKRLIVTSRS